MRLTPAEAEMLVRRRQRVQAAPQGAPLVYLDQPMGGGLRLWLPGRLRNPLNDRGLGHRMARYRYTVQWQGKVAHALLEAGWRQDQPGVEAARAKQVTFQAHVYHRFDGDGLQAALKPARDGLVAFGVLSDDRDSAGHTFTYQQRIDRERRGVLIEVRWGGGVAEILRGRVESAQAADPAGAIVGRDGGAPPRQGGERGDGQERQADAPTAQGRPEAQALLSPHLRPSTPP